MLGLCFVFAPEGGLQEAGAVLEEVVADLAAGEGEGVQGIKIDGGG